MAVNLMALIPNPKDATSFYRGIGPLTSLRKIPVRGESVNIIIPDQVNWATLKMCDAVFMQRPYHKEHLTAARLAKDWNKPLWVDYDDFLLGVPDDNPAFETYASDETKKRIVDIVAMADVVTVSTQALKDLFRGPKSGRPFNKRIYVVPNAFDDDAFRGAPEPKAHNLICWRGTNTHQRDLAEVSEHFVRLSRTKEDWLWSFVGWNPWFATGHMPHKSTKYIAALPVEDYYAYMRLTRPAIQIVPLSDSPFNRSKSSIAWIESTYAGAAVLAPDWEEWRKPGVTTYKDIDDFGVQLEALMNLGPEGRKQANQASWAHIQERLKLSQVNKLRAQVLAGLLGSTWPELAASGEEAMELE